jgi:Cu(I)/Ag(I) efflux system periplasmic protein CusF
MSIYKKTRVAFAALTLTCTLTYTVSAHAASHVMAAPPAASSAAPVTSAEVRKVDKDNKKITLKHGEIKNLDMPPMTMVFKVKDAAMLDKIQAGDKVIFTAEKIDGAYTVTVIEVAKPDTK